LTNNKVVIEIQNFNANFYNAGGSPSPGRFHQSI